MSVLVLYSTTHTHTEHAEFVYNRCVEGAAEVTWQCMGRCKPAFLGEAARGVDPEICARMRSRLYVHVIH